MESNNKIHKDLGVKLKRISEEEMIELMHISKDDLDYINKEKGIATICFIYNRRLDSKKVFYSLIREDKPQKSRIEDYEESSDIYSD